VHNYIERNYLQNKNCAEYCKTCSYVICRHSCLPTYTLLLKNLVVFCCASPHLRYQLFHLLRQPSLDLLLLDLSFFHHHLTSLVASSTLLSSITHCFSFPISKLFFSHLTLHRHLAPIRTDLTNIWTLVWLFFVSAFSSYSYRIFLSFFIFI